MSKPAKYFEIYELIPQDRFELMGEDGWCLLDQKLIDTLDWIRENIDKAMTINDYHWKGLRQFRGWRPEDCAVGAKKSAHKEGRAADFDVSGMTAESVRQWLEQHKNELPHPIRCESDVNWVHIDTKAKEGFKLYFFKP